MKRFALVLAALVVFCVPGFAQESPFFITGPYTYQNLDVFLIHGPSQKWVPDYVPLSTALEQKKARVYETGSVGELTVENLTKDAWIMVHAGDIVRGGQQDRLLRFDMLLAPKSGKVPLESFCVESGRWQGRGAEESTVFSSAPKMAPSKELKMASKKEADQGKVWESVAKEQAGLNEKLRKMKKDETLDVRAKQSATSLALTLEHKDLKDTVKDYVKALQAAPAGKPDVLGFAFGINGKLNSAEVYGTPALFTAFWPRVLEAAATEAVAAYDENVKTRGTVTASKIQEMLTIPGGTKPQVKDLSRDTRILTYEYGQYLMYETRRPDGKAPGPWVHRSYMVQDEKGAPQIKQHAR